MRHGSSEAPAKAISAFTVLIYYALANLAALRLPRSEQRYPRVVAALGLAACLFLAFWVQPTVWITGFALLAVGVLWHGSARRLCALGRKPDCRKRGGLSNSHEQSYDNTFDLAVRWEGKLQ